ncbi:MAG: hypothetical protein ACYCPP_08395 [Nitrososphaerales archaeon]
MVGSAGFAPQPRSEVKKCSISDLPSVRVGFIIDAQFSRVVPQNFDINLQLTCSWSERSPFQAVYEERDSHACPLLEFGNSQEADGKITEIYGWKL